VLHSHQGQYDGTGKIDKGRLASLSRPLSEALDKETAFAEDDFQAQSCLAWIYWLMGDAESACSTLRNNVEQEFARLDGTRKDTAPWTKICAIRACYIKGAALLKRGDTAEAFEVLESSLPILASITSKPLDGSPEQRTWTELLLTQLCILSARAIKARASPSLESEALAAFRAWFSFWERQKGQVMSHGGHLNSSNTPRRLVWKEYFTVLSIILQEGLPYPTTTMATTYNDASTRLLQRSELQRVEAKYEELLLEEVQFPQAEQSADEVEEWAENVIQNWRIVCGSEWQEQDTTRSGSEQASRRVLDILYRAATKTFHSTAVMRHLFTVHLTLGELQLAFKAFDTYLEMVKKGKARFEKTGEVEKGFDDDETILKAISQCIRALCRYSCSDGATKAKDLGHFLEGWLQKAETTNGTSSRGDNGTEIPFQSALSKPVSNSIRAAAWRAVGIAQAQWARYTIEATTRSDIQSRAIKNLQTALLPGTQDVETCFALGTILAEHRQLDAAINVVKRALSHQSSSSTTAVELGPHGGRYARERAMLPLWHLLALLLSAKQEFPTAVRACEGAFEQFKDPKILFGDSETDIAYRSEHLNVKALNEKGASQSWGLVDIMDDIEKETILEVKMTQLALIETQEGPLAAVNASDELLSLFTRLFGEPHKSINQPPKTTQSVVPHSSAGTLRSIKGSIFGRSRRSVTRRSDSVRDQPSISEKSDLHHRPYTTQTQNNALKRTPTIQVTSDSDQGPVPTHHHEKLQKYSASLSRQKSAGSARSRSVSAGPPNGTYSEKALPQRSASQRSRTGTAQRNISTPINTAFVPTSSPESPTRSTPAQLPPIPQNLVQNERELKPAASALQDTRLPYVSPVHMTSTPPTRFPQDQERRGRIGLLIKVWLLIASFYRRAELYEDAKGAIGEAYKLVDGLELDVSRDPNASIYHSWNHYKSVEELWADVWSEVSYCLQKCT
jgi:tetratricopeptide (TPR) repeat protein